jgi:biotin transport system permease protein
MLTRFIGQTTWLHRQPAGRKLLVLAMVSVAMLPVSGPIASGLVLGMVILLYASLGSVGLRRLAQGLYGLAWLVVLIGGAQVFMALAQGTLNDTLWLNVAVAMTKLVSLVLLAELVTITSPLQEMLAAIEPLLRPLRITGVSSSRVALGMGLLIRTTSTQRDNWLQLQQAFLARGLRRPGLRIIPPMLRAGLRQVDQVALALKARTPAATPSRSRPPLQRGSGQPPSH